jgi:putative membrane protein
VFVTFIYALTLSFGDIGKAIVVVVMVVQIAGSSGSYPIEILPEIFSKIYKFFPFPYAINAMREALCGVYRFDMLIYLAELMLFGVLALVIGLVIRRPFIGMNRFVAEKLEETEVL